MPKRAPRSLLSLSTILTFLLSSLHVARKEDDVQDFGCRVVVENVHHLVVEGKTAGPPSGAGDLSRVVAGEKNEVVRRAQSLSLLKFLLHVCLCGSEDLVGAKEQGVEEVIARLLDRCTRQLVHALDVSLGGMLDACSGDPNKCFWVPMMMHELYLRSPLVTVEFGKP